MTVLNGKKSLYRSLTGKRQRSKESKSKLLKKINKDVAKYNAKKLGMSYEDYIDIVLDLGPKHCYKNGLLPNGWKRDFTK